jgi:hypothetical protein
VIFIAGDGLKQKCRRKNLISDRKTLTSATGSGNGYAPAKTRAQARSATDCQKKSRAVKNKFKIIFDKPKYPVSLSFLKRE